MHTFHNLLNGQLKYGKTESNLKIYLVRGAYNTTIEQRMNAITERRDEVNTDLQHLEYQVKERASLVQESKDIVESAAAKIVGLEKDVNTCKNKLIDLNEKQAKAAERQKKADAAKAKRETKRAY